MSNEMTIDLYKKILFRDAVSEATLSSIWRLTQEKQFAFGMITAFRSGQSPMMNMERTNALASHISARGYGYSWLEGHYTENAGTDDAVNVTEYSLFVQAKKPGKQGEADLKKDLLELASKYKQESIFFKPSDSNKGAVVKIDGSEMFGNLDLHPDKMGEYYSKLLRGSQKTFKFECARETRSGMMRWAIRKQNGL